MNPYDYSPQNSHAVCNLEEDSLLWTRHSLSLANSFSGRLLGDSPIMAEYWFPKGLKQAPLAILLHGIGGRNITHCRRIARTLARQGTASVILYLIFNTRRMPLSIRGRYPRLTEEEWFEGYQFSVIDVRQIIDWAQTRPELDAAKVSVIGYSFGSFISSIAMAVDKRIKAGVLIESGGNSGKITKHSLLLRWTYKDRSGEYRRNQESYRRYLLEVEQKGFENVVPPSNGYLIDPLTFSGCLKGRPLLMVSASFDEMIPRVSTLDFWRASGKPPLYWYPATHASLWMWYPWIGRRMTRFLANSL
ncbi:MAG TPA: alpha/beta fold hydrolase [Dehalococcoidales bacterium]